MHGDLNDIKPKVVKLKYAQAFHRHFFNFILESRSLVFRTMEILQMNRICGKLTKMYVLQLPSGKENDS